MTIGQSLAESLMAMGGNLYRDVERELRTGFRLEVAAANARQRRIAQANQRNPRKTVDGLGLVEMSIDPTLKVLAEMEFGEGCFADRRFRKEMLRDMPELRVTTQRKAMIVRP